jgi:hypothetical protein
MRLNSILRPKKQNLSKPIETLSNMRNKTNHLSNNFNSRQRLSKKEKKLITIEEIMT